MAQIQKAGLIITTGLTTPRRAGKEPRPVWNVSGNLAPWTSLLYDMGGKKYHGAFSFFEEPSWSSVICLITGGILLALAIHSCSIS